MEKELTKYELARIIGARALQISMGAPILIKNPEKVARETGFNTIEIAKLEMDAGVLPISVKRK